MKILSAFYHRDDLSQAFFDLQKRVFPGLDLAWARGHDCLPPTTVPFGIFHEGRALSILNATRMDFDLNGATLKALQFGTVATHPDHLRRGLARRLMEHALSAYTDTVDLFFLYANPTVLDFYPKFGFKPIEEPVFVTDLQSDTDRGKLRRLNVHDPVDRDAIIRRFRSRTPISRRFCVRDYHLLATWYCLTFYKDCLWYCDASDTLLVATPGEDALIVFDVVADELDETFFQNLSWPGFDTAVLHFFPDRFTGNFRTETDATDDQLFIMKTRDLPDPQIKIPHLAYT